MKKHTLQQIEGSSPDKSLTSYAKPKLSLPKEPLKLQLPNPSASPSRWALAYRLYYRWKNQYGSLTGDQAKRLKDLEKENARLKRLLAERDLDIDMLRGESSSLQA